MLVQNNHFDEVLDVSNDAEDTISSDGNDDQSPLKVIFDLFIIHELLNSCSNLLYAKILAVI